MQGQAGDSSVDKDLKALTSSVGPEMHSLQRGQIETAQTVVEVAGSISKLAAGSGLKGASVAIRAPSDAHNLLLASTLPIDQQQARRTLQEEHHANSSALGAEAATVVKVAGATTSGGSLQCSRPERLTLVSFAEKAQDSEVGAVMRIRE